MQTILVTKTKNKQGLGDARFFKSLEIERIPTMDMLFLKDYLLDAVVIGIILWCAVKAYQKGAVKAGLGFLPMILAIGAAYFCSPIFSKVLRGTPFFAFLQNKIQTTLNLDGVLGDGILETQTKLIQNMHIPNFLKNSLLENNNPVVYGILKADKLQDYITGYLANVCLNIISVVLIVVLVWFVVKLLLGALNLVMKLPGLSFLNRLCGLMIGTLQGVLIVWLMGLVLTFFYYNPRWSVFFSMLENSKVASIFYENNLLLLMILKIFV